MKHAGGRPPKPTALKILQGNPGKRPLNRAEPTLEIADPERPEHLDEVACQEWDRLVPVLKRMRVLTEADRIALGNLCQTYSTQINGYSSLSLSSLLCCAWLAGTETRSRPSTAKHGTPGSCACSTRTPR
jgi:phage terminase small subunit